MDEEKDLLQDIDVEAIKNNVKNTETIEYVVVEEPVELLVEIDEAFVGTNGVVMPEHTHSIGEIERLEGVLNLLGSARDIYTTHSGYAEFRQWIPKDNPTRGVGYFVGLVKDDTLISGNNVFIDICDTDVSDVYGVTVGVSSICGNQDTAYQLLNEEINNKENAFYSDPPYAKVCLLGTVEVRVATNEEFKNISVGDYVVPNKYGCAIKSSNNVGFRVIEKKDYSTHENAEKIVVIALVPQNDNVARVMKELEGTRLDMQNISLTIGGLNDKIGNIIDTNITINGKFDEIKQEVSNINGVVNAQNKIIEEAQKVVSSSQESIERLHSAYSEAHSDIIKAKDDANQALADITTVKSDMTYFINNKDTIAGFFANDSEAEANLGTLLQKVTNTGTGLTEVKHTINDNGALIEKLALYIDRYSIGDHSPTFGLSYAESLGALSKGDFIYVPISNSTEDSPIYICEARNDIVIGDQYLFTINNITFLFKATENINNVQSIEFDSRVNQLIINGNTMKVSIPQGVIEGTLKWQFSCEQSVEFSIGNVYVWSKDEFVNSKYYWKEVSNDNYKLFGTKAALTDDSKKSGDLWYCADKYIHEDTGTTYEEKTLYLWSGTRWIAVATVNDSNTRSMSYVKQTEKAITSSITNMRGDISSIEQTVDSISSKIENMDSGMLSEINQTAESIMMGIYEPTGNSSSLELLLSGLQSTAYHEGHLKVGGFPGDPKSADECYYNVPPVWNGIDKIFEFEAEPTVGGKYYFNDAQNHDYYCVKTGENSYDIYTLGNKAMANINTRVSNTESSVESWTNFESELNQAITSITQKSNEDAAEMVSMVFGGYKHITAVSDKITEAERGVIGTRYDVAPIWNMETKKFVFDTNQTTTNDGLYCIPTDSKGVYYWELVLGSDKNVIGYKQYEMKASNYASLIQKTNEDGSIAGLFVGNNKVEGGIFINAINDGGTSATIQANKIALNGTTTFADALNPEKTAISGDYIKTGVITSNNYAGPVTYRMYGAKIDEENLTIVTSDIKDCIYYTPLVDVVEMSNFGWTEFNIIDYDEYFSSSPEECYRYEDNEIQVFEEEYGAQVNVLIGCVGETIGFTVRGTGEWFAVIIDNEPIIYSDIDGQSVIECTIDPTLVKDMFWVTGVNATITFTNMTRQCIKGLVDGELSTTNFYYTNDIKTGEILSTTNQDNVYIVSTKDFDLISSDIETQGTKFDLNVGTIYSKNLSLDRNGNLTITGKISATSGWIGDENGNGFKIQSREVMANNKTTYEYYLGNNQITYNGITRPAGVEVGDKGVYLGPDGIGLGNGNFYVDNIGNVTMKGSIVLGGTISWGASNSPVLVLYSKNGSTTPTKDIYDEADDDSTSWHKKYQPTDYYASYSYDGGKEWTTPIKIQGDDGHDASATIAKQIANGTYANGTFIKKKEIFSPTIRANEMSIIPDDTEGSSTASFSLYGYHNNLTDISELYPYLQITLSKPNSTVPEINIDSFPGRLGGAIVNIDFYQTKIDSAVHIIPGASVTVDEGSSELDPTVVTFEKNTLVQFASGCTVTGLGVVPVFE